jgi:hypothetical protein
VRKSPPAANPDAYVAGLSGWRQACVTTLRKAVRSVDGLEEQIKWGHLVYLRNGPVLLVRAEDDRVLLGFWRGQRLIELEPRLRPSGKYEMATVEFREGVAVRPATVRRLAAQAIALNESLGNPTHVAKPDRSKPNTRSAKRT